MSQPNDLSRSLVALDQNSTIIAVVELSQSSWLVGGVVPGIERQPCKKLDPSPERLLAVLHRWRDEAVRAGRTITRISLAFEAGRDSFWLAGLMHSKSLPLLDVRLALLGYVVEWDKAGLPAAARSISGRAMMRRSRAEGSARLRNGAPG
jgi:hypothetical protein